MRILLVGAGGVGTAFARIAARRKFAELIIADYDLARAQRGGRRARTAPAPCSSTPGTSSRWLRCSPSTRATC